MGSLRSSGDSIEGQTRMHGLMSYRRFGRARSLRSSASGKAEHQRRQRKRLTAVARASLRRDGEDRGRGRQCWQIPRFSLLRLRSFSPTLPLPLLTSPALTEMTIRCGWEVQIQVFFWFSFFFQFWFSFFCNSILINKLILIYKSI